MPARSAASWVGTATRARRWRRVSRSRGRSATIAALPPSCSRSAWRCWGWAIGRPRARPLEEALELARRHTDRRDIASALNALAQFHRAEGALDSAEPLYDQVVAIAREIGDRESIAIGLLNLAMVYVDRGDGSRTRATLIEVHTIADEIGSKPVGQSVLEVCAGLAAFERNWTRAARFFGMAEAQNDLTGLHRDPADEAFLLRHVASARAILGTEAFSASEAGGRTLSYAEALADARRWLDGGG